MAKKKSAAASATTTTTTPKSVAHEVQFPSVTDKEYLACNVLSDDQIILLDDLFSAEECKAFVRFIESLPLELTPPKKKGEAERVNHRISITAPDFARRLHDVIAPHLPLFPHPASVRRPGGGSEGRAPSSLNSNIRMYKYTPGQHFGPHYDDAVRDAVTGDRSEWTLLVYLTGVQDGVEGGETLFYKQERGKPKETITPPLTRGTALLHRHGNECLLHEGSPVLKGTKYILRSDLMFKS
ncbi:2OG-Fe(II) oxygenase [Phanerochaete sordida]|uniref:2OG-Fe(II) oxygenase n=1 Tax=Phanerochaete sordida TaxID=48140 RepID=A0A9P3LII2_9APHY|nr:2OG-Fe(II) oxygenase [Phanerochaete sordida]